MTRGDRETRWSKKGTEGKKRKKTYAFHISFGSVMSNSTPNKHSHKQNIMNTSIIKTKKQKNKKEDKKRKKSTPDTGTKNRSVA